MHQDPSRGTLVDTFKDLASSMPIPDEFEYEFEFQAGKSDVVTFTYDADETSNVFAEYPPPEHSSQYYSRRSRPMALGSSELESVG